MFGKKIKKIIALAAAGAMALSAALTSYAADNSYVRDNAGFLIKNGQHYVLDGTSGVYAFSVLDAKTDLNTPRVINAYTGDAAIPGSTSYPRGDNAAKSALRYNGSMDVKMGMFDTQNRTWLKPPLSDGKYYLSFRFAGIGITNISASNIVSAEAITNPNFVSDSISATGTEDAQTATVYGYKEGTSGYVADQPIVYGYGGGFHEIDPDSAGLAFYSTGVSYNGNPWPGTVSQVEEVYAKRFTNHNATAFNNDLRLARIAFENWETTEAGAHYWAQAEKYLDTHDLSAYGIDEPWKLLNALFQITGNPESSETTTIYYCTFMVKGKPSFQYYNTYAYTPGITKNMAPTYLGLVSDEGSTAVTQAVREQSQADLKTGAQQIEFAETIDIAREEPELLNANMSFFADKQGEATKNTNRTISVGLMDGDNWRNIDTQKRPKAAVNLDAAIRAEDQSSDGLDSGPIVASQSGTSYYQGAKFEIRLALPSDAPNTGRLRVAVSDDYTMAGDNGLPADDILEIPYTTNGGSDSGGGGDIHEDRDNKGDMNIGLPQERSLHYVALEPEETDPTAEPEIDPATGLPVPPKMIFVERYSDYGNYPVPDIAVCSNENVIGEEDPGNWGDGVHDVPVPSLTDGSIVAAWWHYDSNDGFPSEINDRVWAEKTGSKGTYTRSETATHVFDIGTNISRSRGSTSAITNPTAKIWVYGVYPDERLDTVEDNITDKFAKNGLSTNADGSVSITAGVGLGVYDTVQAYLRDLTVGSDLGGIYYPRLRIVSEVNAPSSSGGSGVHGESGLFTDYTIEPRQNSWDTASDRAERTLLAESDDMIIMEAEVTDSEGYIVYHADRYSNEGGSMTNIMNDAAFDREEDLKLRVVVKQNESASHIVKDPAIEVTVSEKGKNDGIINYCVPGVEYESSWKSNDELYATYEIYFRPTSGYKLGFDIKIADKHGAAYWRENKWDEERDQHSFGMSSANAQKRTM